MTIEEAKARLHEIFREASSGIEDAVTTLALKLEMFAEDVKQAELDEEIMADVGKLEATRFVAKMAEIEEYMK